MIFKTISFYLFKKRFSLLFAYISVSIFGFMYHGVSSAVCWDAFLTPGEKFLFDLQKGQYDKTNHFVTTLPGFSFQAAVPFLGRVIEKRDENLLLIERVYASSGKTVQYPHMVRMPPFGDKRADYYFLSDSYFFNKVVRGDSRQLQMIYRALKSNRREVSNDDLKFFLVNREQLLKNQGFDSFYIRGLDAAYKNIALVKQLRQLRANPYNTHIEPFAEAALAHLAFMSKGIDISTKEGVEKKKALDTLRRRAKRAIKNKRVTYQWWLRFHYALSSLFSKERGKLSRRQLEYINQFVPHFPAVVLMPTIVEGHVGVITLNKSSSEGVLMVGLANRNIRMYNEFINPIDLFKYDLEYSSVLAALNYMDTGITYKRFYNKLIETRGLSVKQRQDVELVHFILTRVLGYHPIVDFKKRDEIIDMVSAVFVLDLKDFNLFSNPSKTAEIVDNYMRASSRAKQYFGLDIEHFSVKH